MPTLLLRFPGGRYHATPSGHHVNEGHIEWPPSPWRLLRALLACGYTTLGWTEVPPAGRRLIETLAGVLPDYRLPPASAAHSRHYMPIPGKNTTLVFDTWANIGDGSLAVTWDTELDPEATELLGTLAANLNYLGRSESWVEAQLLAPDEALPQGDDCLPHQEGQGPKRGWEQISTMAVEDPQTFQTWRDAQVDDALAPYPLPESKKPTKKLLKDREKACSPYPDDLIDALQWDTARWKQHRWSQAPGSRRVLYWRQDDALDIAQPTRPTRPRIAPVQSMLLALTTTSGRRGGLPTVARTLPQAELLHRSLISHLGKGEHVDCPVLTGKDADDRPLTGHQHARILPLDLDGDGYLDHILIHAPMGLAANAQAAIRSVRRTYTKGAADLQVALAASGYPKDLLQIGEPIGQGLHPYLGSARIWQSVTPFVPPRHLKRRGHNALEGQIAAELKTHGLPSATIKVFPFTDEEKARPLRHHIRVRRDTEKAPPIDCGFAVELTFDEPQHGPISLGYASHFGLGLFASAQESP
ncbi:MAG: type I-U CRISPR-associated protein Cas5/Cas6 [Planctomycetota bacterium]|nr:MAG: type I-U CRISPR-associated protein Cas5/Cas6 [Planctomycetota bacterium]